MLLIKTITCITPCSIKKLAQIFLFIKSLIFACFFVSKTIQFTGQVMMFPY